MHPIRIRFFDRNFEKYIFSSIVWSKNILQDTFTHNDIAYGVLQSQKIHRKGLVPHEDRQPRGGSDITSQISHLSADTEEGYEREHIQASGVHL